VPRKSRASAADRPPPTPGEARTLALGWLGMRELSKLQVRQRLRRRGVDAEVAEEIVAWLIDVGALNEDRLALAAARRETSIRGRGPVRARLALKALGLGDATVQAALETTLAQVDVDALLERAIDKRLRGQPAGKLDRAAFRRIAGALVRQGFDLQAVMNRLRRRGAAAPDDGS
jgi:regulatory protein